MNEKWIDQFQLGEQEPATEKVLAIDIEKIRSNPFQPRKEFTEEAIEELAQSIKACGLIQPVVVRRSGEGYQLVVGERRFKACKKLGWQKISASVRNLSDSAMATIALIENLQRENLNFIEEALGYVSLMKNFNLTQELLAQRLGKSQSTIANKIRLLKLSPTVQQKLLQHGLTERHGRALLKIDSEEEQIKTIQEIAERGLTVSQAEKRIAKTKSNDRDTDQKRRVKPIIRDMRIVLNTIREAVAMIENYGFYPDVDETIEPDYIEVTIRLTREMLKEQKGAKNAG